VLYGVRRAGGTETPGGAEHVRCDGYHGRRVGGPSSEGRCCSAWV
jgi:hypothetical protein